MDPKACLDAIRRLIDDISDLDLDVGTEAALGLELADAVDDLDGWMKAGGANPWEEEAGG